MSGFSIRPAIKSDCGEIFRLIQELAEFEKSPNVVQITKAQLEHDGFTVKPPLWKAFVAEVKESDPTKNRTSVLKLVGFALYSHSYSSWKGLRMILDHIFVSKDFRSLDLEKNLYEVYIQTGLDLGCSQVDWFCLESNPARKFYGQIGATNITEKEDWHVYRLDRNTMLKISSGSKLTE